MDREEENEVKVWMENLCPITINRQPTDVPMNDTRTYTHVHNVPTLLCYSTHTPWIFLKQNLQIFFFGTHHLFICLIFWQTFRVFSLCFAFAFRIFLGWHRFQTHAHTPNNNKWFTHNLAQTPKCTWWFIKFYFCCKFQISMHAIRYTTHVRTLTHFSAPLSMAITMTIKSIKSTIQFGKRENTHKMLVDFTRTRTSNTLTKNVAYIMPMTKSILMCDTQKQNE